MRTYSVGGRATIAGTNLLPLASLYAVASRSGRMREIGVFNTTATGAFVVGICRLTTAGTQGTALTEAQHDPADDAPDMTAFNGHTAGPTLADLGYRKTMGAAIGDGVIWTFGAKGLVIPAGTAQGIGLYVPTGTGQICDFYFVWEE